MKRAFLSILAAATLSGTVAQADTVTVVTSDIGKVVAAASNGMTLYTFRKDAANKSNCYNDCADAWPPFTAGASAKASGSLGIIDRRDGTRQWTINGKPVYFWVGDAEKGDTTGDGVGGVWDVVRG